MAASINIATPVKVGRLLGTGTANPGEKRLLEKAAQTFLIGTPLSVEVASGFVIACAAITNAATAIIAGFAVEPASNLTTNGVAKTLTYGSVQNQASAALIPFGAPPNDGTVGMAIATDDVYFIGTCGHGATAANATLAQTDVGAIFGLTKDLGNNLWYVDKNITTVGTGACVQIMDLLSPVLTLNGLYLFKVTHAAQQLSV